jgi:O-antigen/teichoic acid export membrane protein
MGTIMLMRVVIAAIGTVVALLFALVAGYTGVMIAGTAIGCLALGFTLIQQSATIPLQSELRFGATSILELVRAATAAVGIVALVIVGASLFDFLIWPLPVALTVLAATLLIMRRRGELLPRYRRDELRYIGRETLPAAASSVLNSVFYRVSIIVMSIVASGRELGYYSASYRVIESLIIVPSLLVGTAFPIMARAAETDLVRLRYILQRLFDVGALLGIGTALMLVVGAPSAIYVLAGPDFNPAIPALRLQGLAMGASFLVPVWAGALWNLRLRGPLVIANLVGLVAAIVFVFIGAQQGATGTAIGATAAEFVYVGALWTALVRSRPDLAVGLAVPPRALLAAIVAAAALLVPVPHAVQIPIAGVIYLVVLFATRAVPPELLAALRTRRLVE